MKYIIFWTLIKIVYDPCPDMVKSHANKFGVVGNTMMNCSVVHCHSEIVGEKEKYFYNRDSANLFYKEAINYSKIWRSGISGVKIDSVKL